MAFGYRLTEEQCPRCGRNLSDRNTNPDRLCGYCQQDFKSGGAKHARWVAAGRPRELTKPNGPRLPRKPRDTKPVAAAPAKPAKRTEVPANGALSAYPTPFLVACARELERRVALAREILSATRKAGK